MLHSLTSFVCGLEGIDLKNQKSWQVYQIDQKSFKIFVARLYIFFFGLCDCKWKPL